VYGIVVDHPELMVPWGISRELSGVEIHRSRTLAPGDLQTRRGVLVTTPVRTIVDLAARIHEPLLGTIVDEGTISRLWTPEKIMARLDQLGRGVPGRAELAGVLSRRLGEGQPDSRLEQRIFRIVMPVFPGYTLHHRVMLEGQIFDMDIAWLHERIDGEVDGFAARSGNRSKFESSARRANILSRHGWRVVHLTHQMDGNELIAQLAPYFSSSR
jgi:hypothetical protein